MSKYINLIGQITERLDVPCGNIRLGIHEALAYLDRNPDQVPGRTITESSDRYVFDGASVLAVEFGRVVESDDGYLQPHPEFPDRHTITAMLKDGDHLPTVGAKDRITVIIEKADPEPTNAEKLEAHLLDLLGVVEAIGNTGVHNMAYELDRAGVTALGGRDE